MMYGQTVYKPTEVTYKTYAIYVKNLNHLAQVDSALFMVLFKKAIQDAFAVKAKALSVKITQSTVHLGLEGCKLENLAQLLINLDVDSLPQALHGDIYKCLLDTLYDIEQYGLCTKARLLLFKAIMDELQHKRSMEEAKPEQLFTLYSDVSSLAKRFLQEMLLEGCSDIIETTCSNKMSLEVILQELLPNFLQHIAQRNPLLMQIYFNTYRSFSQDEEYSRIALCDLAKNLFYSKIQEILQERGQVHLRRFPLRQGLIPQIFTQSKYHNFFTPIISNLPENIQTILMQEPPKVVEEFGAGDLTIGTQFAPGMAEIADYFSEISVLFIYQCLFEKLERAKGTKDCYATQVRNKFKRLVNYWIKLAEKYPDSFDFYAIAQQELESLNLVWLGKQAIDQAPRRFFSRSEPSTKKIGIIRASILEILRAINQHIGKLWVKEDIELVQTNLETIIEYLGRIEDRSGTLGTFCKLVDRIKRDNWGENIAGLGADLNELYKYFLLDFYDGITVDIAYLQQLLQTRQRSDSIVDILVNTIIVEMQDVNEEEVHREMEIVNRVLWQKHLNCSLFRMPLVSIVPLIGREEIIDRIFESTRQVIVLSGMKGVGKKHIAYQIIQQRGAFSMYFGPNTPQELDDKVSFIRELENVWLILDGLAVARRNEILRNIAGSQVKVLLLTCEHEELHDNFEIIPVEVIGGNQELIQQLSQVETTPFVRAFLATVIAINSEIKKYDKFGKELYQTNLLEYAKTMLQGWPIYLLEEVNVAALMFPIAELYIAVGHYYMQTGKDIALAQKNFQIAENMFQKFNLCHVGEIAEYNQAFYTLLAYAELLYYLGRIHFYRGDLLSDREAHRYFLNSLSICERIQQAIKQELFHSVLVRRSGLLELDFRLLEKFSQANLITIYGSNVYDNKLVAGYNRLLEGSALVYNARARRWESRELAKDIYHVIVCGNHLSKIYQLQARLVGLHDGRRYYERSIIESNRVMELACSTDFHRVANCMVVLGLNIVEKYKRYPALHDVLKATQLFRDAIEIELLGHVEDFPLADAYYALALLYRNRQYVNDSDKIQMLRYAKDHINECVRIRTKLKHGALQEALLLQLDIYQLLQEELITMPEQPAICDLYLLSALPASQDIQRLPRPGYIFTLDKIFCFNGRGLIEIPMVIEKFRILKIWLGIVDSDYYKKPKVLSAKNLYDITALSGNSFFSNSQLFGYLFEGRVSFEGFGEAGDVFTCLGIDKLQAFDELEQNVHQAQVRQLIAPQIVIMIKGGYIPDIMHQHQELRELRLEYYRGKTTEQRLLDYCTQEEVVREYIKSYVDSRTQDKMPLLAMPNTLYWMLGKTGVLDAIITLRGLPGVCVWQEFENIAELRLAHMYGNQKEAIHLLATNNRKFRRLRVQGPIEEPVVARHETKVTFSSIGDEELPEEVSVVECEVAATVLQEPLAVTTQPASVSLVTQEGDAGAGCSSWEVTRTRAFSAQSLARSMQAIIAMPPYKIYKRGDESFVEHEVGKDGNCGYTSFGITRENALQLILNSLAEVGGMLRPVIEEQLLLANFQDYLNKQSSVPAALKDVFFVYQEASKNGGSLDVITQELRSFASDENVIRAYVKYDIEAKNIDGGWAHPLILQVLARLRNVELYIWQLDASNQIIPHRVAEYHHYAAQTQAGQSLERIDLLFVNGNHFNRLERQVAASCEQSYVASGNCR